MMTTVYSQYNNNYPYPYNTSTPNRSAHISLTAGNSSTCFSLQQNNVRVVGHTFGGVMRIRIRPRDLKTIYRAADTDRPSIQNMGIDHRGSDVFVSQEFLDRSNVVTVFQEVRRK